jgi:AhpD family alkylhydroperoxidase
MTYQQQADLHLLGQARRLAGTEFDAFIAFHESAFRDGGSVPRKYRELIGLAVGAATKCGYCIDTHTRGAASAGASSAEMTEAVLVAAAVCAGGTAAHSLLALRLLNEASGDGEAGQ